MQTGGKIIKTSDITSAMMTISESISALRKDDMFGVSWSPSIKIRFMRQLTHMHGAWIRIILPATNWTVTTIRPCNEL